MWQQFVSVVIVCFVASCSFSESKSLDILEEPKQTWTKQQGTVSFPKTLADGCTIKSGEVFTTDGALYRAKMSGKTASLVQIHGLPARENQGWRKLQLGSITLPRFVGEDEGLVEGDIYLDAVSGRYYRAMSESGKTRLVQINEKANWMELLQDEIGDLPLGDVITPGTHDSGTAGVDDKSYLVERTTLFMLAQAVEPQILANWSLTQETTIGSQLNAGFRSFDMRIADMEAEDGSFRWWHGVTGYEIQIELAEIVDFVETNPSEIVRLNFGHFARPGNALSPTLPIPNYRKDQIHEILVEYLGPYLVPQSAVSDNPSMNEVLATGGRIILIMRDSYLEAKHEGFWTNVLAGGWSGRTNPEDLFLERSGRLRGYLDNAVNRMSEVSGCNTPDESMIVPGLLRVYGHNDTIMDVIRDLFPEIDDLEIDRTGFEGLWMSLVDFTRYGTNTAGMWSRPDNLYTSGASVHYRGVNAMVEYWLARPQRYKLNEIHVDDATESSSIVDTAIRYHSEGIPREVTIAFQGNAKDGYYRWDEEGIHTEGGTDGLACSSQLDVRYQVTSEDYAIDDTWYPLASKATVSLQEGEFPPDSFFKLQVAAPNWLTIHEDNVQNMIDNNLDLYLRGAELEDGAGLAYTSYIYDLFGTDCGTPPDSGFLELVQW